MIRCIKQLWRDESGISAIEYALIAGLIALAIVTGAGLLGDTVNNKFNDVASQINAS